LTQARSGDPENIGRLLDEYRPYLLLIANQDMDSAVKGKLGSSDVVQESMLAAHRNFEQFRGESKAEFLGWLRTILVNDMRAARRSFKVTQKRMVGRESPIDADSFGAKRLVDQELTPSTNAMQQEEAQLLQRALSCLSDEQKQVIELHDWQQKSFVEIGMVVGKSPDAVRKVWTRAIVKLQQIMIDEKKSDD